jgi:hypothetical protein
MVWIKTWLPRVIFPHSRTQIFLVDLYLFFVFYWVCFSKKKIQSIETEFKPVISHVSSTFRNEFYFIKKKKKKKKKEKWVYFGRVVLVAS